VDQHNFQLVVGIAAGVITLSFLVQMFMFIFIYSGIRKLNRLAASLQEKAEPVITKVGPMLDQMQGTLVNVKGAVDRISDQARETFDRVAVETRAIAAAISVSTQEISNIARHQAESLSLTLDYTNSALHKQIGDLDAMLSRTQDRIEYTTMEVQSTVLDPVRELSALLIGLRRSLDVLFRRRRKQIDQAFQDEELFI
jgi:hypothetical protein